MYVKFVIILLSISDMDAALNNFVSWTVWTKSYLNTSIYNPYTGTHFCQPASLYQLMKEITRRSGSIALNSRNYSSPIDYKVSSDGRYVLVITALLPVVLISP